MKSLLLVAFLVLFQTTKGDDLVQTSCKKAADNDPNLNYNFCVSTLEARPKSHGADLAGIVIISLELTVAKATSTESTISKLLKNPKMDKPALQDCSDLYSDAIPSLQEATDAFKSKDYGTALIRISAALDTFDTCETGFKERKATSPLAKENNDFAQLSVMSLAFINQLRGAA